MMDRLNTKTKATIFLIVSIIISFLVMIVLKKEFDQLLDWLSITSYVITIEFFCFWLFSTYLWKLRIFRNWLVPFPDLTGTWVGYLQTTWQDPETGKTPAPIKCMLVINHNYYRIKVNFLSAESISYSYSEEIKFEKDTNLKRVSYQYTNEPSIILHDRSKSHDGTMVLALIEKDTLKLKGVYYTDRKSTGEIEVSLQTRKLLDDLSQID